MCIICKILGVLFFALPIDVCLAQQIAFAESNVSLKLPEVMGLELNGRAGGMVNFDFGKVESYTKGISILMRDQLVVTANRKFNLVARAASDNFTSDGFDFIPASVLEIYIVNTEIKGKYQNLPIEHLSTINLPLLLQAPPLSNHFLNIRYTIPSDQARKFILGKRPGMYTNAVIYTLTIQ